MCVCVLAAIIPSLPLSFWLPLPLSWNSLLFDVCTSWQRSSPLYSPLRWLLLLLVLLLLTQVVLCLCFFFCFATLVRSANNKFPMVLISGCVLRPAPRLCSCCQRFACSCFRRHSPEILVYFLIGRLSRCCCWLPACMAGVVIFQIDCYGWCGPEIWLDLRFRFHFARFPVRF